MNVLNHGLKKELLRRLKKLCDEGAAPGFQLGLGWKNQFLGTFCYGVADLKYRRPVTPRTIFDLASLTKILSTVSLLMRAVQEKKLSSLDLPLRNFFPFFSSELKNKTIADLLNHRSGLPPIFDDVLYQGLDLPTREDRLRFFLRKIDENFQDRVGIEEYSDIGFMILGALVEVLYSRRLNELMTDDNLGYGPLIYRYGRLRYFWNGWQVASCLSLDPEPRWLRGEVQDPRAQWLSGMAGHAGLFGSVQGIEKWASNLFMSYHGKGIQLSDRVVATFLAFDQRAGAFLNGFDLPSEKNSQAGSSFPRTTVGHLGYTGTSFWMDMQSGARITLLSHRFQPKIDPQILRILRPAFHDWLWENVFSKIKS